MARPDFDLKALYNAINEQRLSREMSWAAVTREISRNNLERNPLPVSTITGLKDKTIVEGDGVLQMLLWLHRTPESFIPGFEKADADCFQLPEPGKGQVLRWDAKGLYEALNARGQTRAMSWKDVAEELSGITPEMLSHLAKGGRVGFPSVMRMVDWLDQPAVRFTRITDW